MNGERLWQQIKIILFLWCANNSSTFTLDWYKGKRNDDPIQKEITFGLEGVAILCSLRASLPFRLVKRVTGKLLFHSCRETRTVFDLHPRTSQELLLAWLLLYVDVLNKGMTNIRGARTEINCRFGNNSLFNYARLFTWDAIERQNQSTRFDELWKIEKFDTKSIQNIKYINVSCNLLCSIQLELVSFYI